MSVQDIDLDLIGYGGKKDFQVLSSYVDKNRYVVTVIRLDTTSDEGWTEKLKVLVFFRKSNKTNTILFGPSSVSRKSIEVVSEDDIGSAGPASTEFSQYTNNKTPVFQHITKKSFNRIFDANVVTLPLNLFAVGVKNGNVYIYNETFEMLYMIELSIANIVNTSINNKIFRKFHFVICASDGYMERHFPSVRNNPLTIGDSDMAGVKEISMSNPDAYPVFYNNKFVLAQNNQVGVSNVINFPDRYYFYMNKYNEYRSIHKGTAFSSKINKIVFGSQKRGSSYNFTNRRDITVSPREYFNSDAVPKDNIVSPKWINRDEMIKYKYILDIDGHASTWDATAWKLNSGSVILKSDSCWGQWFFDKYKPWIHYVPVKDDFSDIQEQYSWCEANQDKCVEMINNCKDLFQQVYRYNNVVNYVSDSLYKMNNLTPIKVGSRRLFVITCCSKVFDNIPMTSVAQPSTSRVNIYRKICEMVNPNDIILYLSVVNTDIVNFEAAKFLEAYDSLNAKIVFGPEKNLWPGEAADLRHKLDTMAGNEKLFKYLNIGFLCAEAGEMAKLLDEQVEDKFGEQEYFMRAYAQEKYSMTLDYGHKLVFNTYMCSEEEIKAARNNKVPFIHFNAGR